MVQHSTTLLLFLPIIDSTYYFKASMPLTPTVLLDLYVILAVCRSLAALVLEVAAAVLEVVGAREAVWHQEAAVPALHGGRDILNDFKVTSAVALTTNKTPGHFLWKRYWLSNRRLPQHTGV